MTRHPNRSYYPNNPYEYIKYELAKLTPPAPELNSVMSELKKLDDTHGRQRSASPSQRLREFLSPSYQTDHNQRAQKALICIIEVYKGVIKTVEAPPEHRKHETKKCNGCCPDQLPIHHIKKDIIQFIKTAFTNQPCLVDDIIRIHNHCYHALKNSPSPLAEQNLAIELYLQKALSANAIEQSLTEQLRMDLNNIQSTPSPPPAKRSCCPHFFLQLLPPPLSPEQEMHMVLKTQGFSHNQVDHYIDTFCKQRYIPQPVKLVACSYPPP